MLRTTVSHPWPVLLACVAIVRLASPPLHSRCWKEGYTAAFCCDRTLGPTGNENCWAAGIEYSDCCVVDVSQRKEPSISQTRPSSWCGPVCFDGHNQERPWEALRNTLVAVLVSKNHPERSLLTHIGILLNKSFDQKNRASLAPECYVGSLLLRLIDATRLDVALRAVAFANVVKEMLLDPYLFELAYCSGWPIFRFLSLVTYNISVDAKSIVDIRYRFFDLPSHVNTTGRTMILHRAFSDCRAMFSLDDCLLGSKALLEDYHLVQNQAMLGYDSCPPRSFATWLDRMEPVQAFPLCVRSEYNLIDDTIRKQGKWPGCKPLIDLVLGLGSPGCRVLDIGANIGACSIALAHLGYHVTSFEPLPRNADLMRSSLQLNGIPNSESAAEGIGSVTLHEIALSSRAGKAHIVEGQKNAGMTITIDHWPIANCLQSEFRCHSPFTTTTTRLDSIWQPNEEICLAKLDVEGHELPVLLGALELLRDRVIRTLYIEWWPPHMKAFNEHPLSLLWLLHSLNYHVYAPAEWFDKRLGDSRWYMVVPEEFSWLLSHWGDIVARAVEW